MGDTDKSTIIARRPDRRGTAEKQG